MFGRINNLLYQKRRAGNDVIDLGMGNPSDPPEPLVIEKLSEAARADSNHGYSKSNGILNLRREVASKIPQTLWSATRPRIRSDGLLGLERRILAHVLSIDGPR